MRIVCMIFCLIMIFSSSIYAECVKKQGIVDWILGEYTIECSESYSASYKMSNNDSGEDILVRAGLVAAGILIIWHIYEYGQQPKYNPSILYYHLSHRRLKPMRFLKSLSLEPSLFIGKKIGLGFSLRF